MPKSSPGSAEHAREGTILQLEAWGTTPRLDPAVAYMVVASQSELKKDRFSFSVESIGEREGVRLRDLVGRVPCVVGMRRWMHGVKANKSPGLGQGEVCFLVLVERTRRRAL